MQPASGYNTIQAILFDKDGTLLDFNRTWLPAYRAAARYLEAVCNGRISASQFLQAGGYIAETSSWQTDSLLASGSNRQIRDSWGEMIGRPLSQQQVAELSGFFHRDVGDYIATVPNLKACLGGLRERGLELGIATMDDARQAEKVIDAFDIRPLISFACGADSGYGVKPDPGMVLGFADHLGIEPASVAMIGDSPRDIKMGINAGAGLSIGVASGAHVAGELALYTPWVIDSINELENLLVETGNIPCLTGTIGN